MKSFSNETLNVKFEVAIATLKNLLKIAVLKEHLNKTDMEKVD